jgi:hypothetical protein
MSIQAVAWVLEEEATTTGTARLVLLSLANHANDRGEAYPGIATICREARVSERRCHDALRSLVAAGLISREVNAAPDERIPANKRPNLYRLVGWTNRPPVLSPGVADFVSRGGRSRRLGVDGSSTQTINEPSRTAGARSPARAGGPRFMPGSGWIAPHGGAA